MDVGPWALGLSSGGCSSVQLLTLQLRPSDCRRTLCRVSPPVYSNKLVIWFPSPQQIRSSKSKGGRGAAGSRHTKSVKK